MDELEPFVLTAWTSASKPVVKRCSSGHRLWTWCERLIDERVSTAAEGPDGDRQIERALWLLQDGYFAHRSKAPAAHQDVLRHGDHQCLYAVYVDAYQRILEVRLQRPDPPAFVPVMDVPDSEDEDDDAFSADAWLGTLRQGRPRPEGVHIDPSER
jgi:hypothetical protein